VRRSSNKYNGRHYLTVSSAASVWAPSTNHSVRHQLIDCLPAGTASHPGAINEMLRSTDGRCNSSVTSSPARHPVIIRRLHATRDMPDKSGDDRCSRGVWSAERHSGGFYCYQFLELRPSKFRSPCKAPHWTNDPLSPSKAPIPLPVTNCCLTAIVSVTGTFVVHFYNSTEMLWTNT